jgi:hypothetical protein
VGHAVEQLLPQVGQGSGDRLDAGLLVHRQLLLSLDLLNSAALSRVLGRDDSDEAVLCSCFVFQDGAIVMIHFATLWKQVDMTTLNLLLKLCLIWSLFWTEIIRIRLLRKNKEKD